MDHAVKNDLLFHKKGQDLVNFWQSFASGMSKLDLIYTSPETGAKLYTGSKMAASDKKCLEKYKIDCIVNTAKDIPNFFQDDPNYTYLRFNIATGVSQFVTMADTVEQDADVLDFVDSVLQTIDQWLQDGKNVIIHCYAGAHRAGTTTVLFLMRKFGYTSAEGIKQAKLKRSVIAPFGVLLKFLNRVDKAVSRLSSSGKLTAEDNWYQAADAIYSREAALILDRNGERHQKISLMYTDEITGSNLYTGSEIAASSAEFIQKYEISCIVNATVSVKNAFEENDQIKYLRFPISEFARNLSSMKDGPEKDERILDFINPMLNQVDEWISEGRNILIHCQAGVHRAGTTTVLFFMRRFSLTSKQALIEAKKKRPYINPILNLSNFLTLVDTAISRKLRPTEE